MSIDTQTSFCRAPRIKGAVRTPISLSPEELAKAVRYAAAEERSLSSFLRVIYLRGLKNYESQLTSLHQPG